MADRVVVERRLHRLARRLGHAVSGLTHWVAVIRHSWRNPIVVALTLLVIVLGVAFGALTVQVQKDHRATQSAERAASSASSALIQANTALVAVRAQQAHQHIQLQQSCERLNVQRANANQVYLDQYKVDRVVLLFATQTPVRPEARQFERVFLPQLEQAVSDARWTPLTDCVEAVAEKGSAFTAPLPLRFRTHPVPASALDVRNAQRLDPKGSIP